MAVTDTEKRTCSELLHHIEKSGILEAECERNRRHRQLPSDIVSDLQERNGPILSRAISGSEAELVRYACSIPPVAALDRLSTDDLVGLADLFEGWAQDSRLDTLMMVKLLGWSDGCRLLVAAVGPDHQPPNKDIGERDHLLKFIATRMRV